jgi:hypothetical protein
MAYYPKRRGHGSERIVGLLVVIATALARLIAIPVGGIFMRGAR